MNAELQRWVVGVLLGLILGAYGYTWSAASTLEDRISRQLDIIERKIDTVITRQWEQKRQ